MPDFGLPGFTEDLAVALDRLADERAETPVIQPAEPFLDMAGEDLRRRIFLTGNDAGEALCLRPEFTIPVCVAHIAAAKKAPRRYAYLGQVFRQRRDGPSEFYQAGIEDLGDEQRADADARALAGAMTLVGAVLPDHQPGHDLTLRIGDQAVFEAVVAGLGLPAGWQKRLIHAFGNTEALNRLIARLTAPEGEGGTDDPVVDAFLKAGDRAGLETHIESVMAATGYSTHASRSPREIAARLAARQELEATRLAGDRLAALQAFLALEAPLDQAATRLAEFADKAGLDIAEALGGFSERVRALTARGSDPAGMTWQAAFGRPLDYYTGLVFEIVASSSGRVLAGGGRYDRLMTLLGAEAPIPAVGFSLWIDRLDAERSAA